MLSVSSWCSRPIFITVFSLCQLYFTQAMLMHDKVPNTNAQLSGPPSTQISELLQPHQPYRWMSVRPHQQQQEYPLQQTASNELKLLLQYLEKRSSSESPDSNLDETQREIRSPLGTMRFGKRDGELGKRNPLGTMRFGKRSNPLGTMRFGKRTDHNDDNQ